MHRKKGSRGGMFILFVAASTFYISSANRKSYDESKVLQIPLEALNLLKHHLETEDVEMWRKDETHCELFVTAQALIEVKNILDKNYVTYTVLIENVQAAINKEYHDRKLVGTRSLEGKKMSWDAYHSLKDISKFTDQLAKDYPHRVHVVNVGKSVRGKQMKVAIFKTGIKNAKRIWLDGGIHAREWIAPAVVTYVMRELAEMNASNSGPLSKIDFYVCPVVNPDGYEYTHTTDRLWRKNRNTKYTCSGVDLNRNFKSNDWKRSNKCNSEYPGPSAFSEPESRNIAKFIMKNKKNLMGFITFHSYSQVVIYPNNKTEWRKPLLTRHKALVKVGRKIAKKISKEDGHIYHASDIFNFTEGQGAYGTSIEWAMDIGIKYPYAIELRPGASSDRPGFLLPPNEIIPTAKESLVSITALASAILKKDDDVVY